LWKKTTRMPIRLCLGRRKGTEGRDISESRRLGGGSECKWGGEEVPASAKGFALADTRDGREKEPGGRRGKDRIFILIPRKAKGPRHFRHGTESAERREGPQREKGKKGSSTRC